MPGIYGGMGAGGQNDYVADMMSSSMKPHYFTQHNPLGDFVRNAQRYWHDFYASRVRPSVVRAHDRLSDIVIDVENRLGIRTHNIAYDALLQYR